MNGAALDTGLRRFAIVLAALLASCGYVGAPLPPALNIPVRITDLNAVERGDQIIIQFTVPRMTTEGLVLKKYGELDVRAGWAGVRPFNMPTWVDHASRIAVAGEVKPGPLRLTTPAAPWVNKNVLVGVRLSNHRGRWSEWSNLAALQVVPPLKTPTALSVRAVPNGVRLKWSETDTRPGIRFRIYRRETESKVTSLAGEASKTEWTDSGTEYGKTYEYRVQAVLPAGDKFAQSELGRRVTITPEDVFPPAVPTGLRAVAGLNTIELTWERGTDSDLAFYRVYRATDGQGSKKIADSVAVPSYSDYDVVSGRRYRYTITAVDRLGNESKPSAPVTQVAP